MKTLLTTLILITSVVSPVFSGEDVQDNSNKGIKPHISNVDIKLAGLLDIFKRNKSYNVYFYFPDNQEVHLGVSESVNDCQSLAINYASRKDIIDADWGYICCLKTKKSECAEKHR